MYRCLRNFKELIVKVFKKLKKMLARLFFKEMYTLISKIY